MGQDPTTATCEPTSKTANSVVYTYGFDECGTTLSRDTDGNFVYQNRIGRSGLLANGVYRDLGKDSIAYSLYSILRFL